MNDYRRRVKRYQSRVNYHVKEFFKRMNEGDIIQAAEKAWGAISAFVNIYAITFHNTEVKRDYRKREVLEEFLNEIKKFDLEVEELIAKEYRGHTGTLARSLWNLHSFFYGGANIKDEDVKRYLQHLYKLLPILQEYSNIIAEYYLREGLSHQF